MLHFSYFNQHSKSGDQKKQNPLRSKAIKFEFKLKRQICIAALSNARVKSQLRMLREVEGSATSDHLLTIDTINM